MGLSVELDTVSGEGRPCAVHFGTALSLASLSAGVLAVFSAGMLIYLAFRYAQQLLRPLGETGTVVFLRLSAFILLCLGVQIVWVGASELLVEVMTRASRAGQSVSTARTQNFGAP